MARSYFSEISLPNVRTEGQLLPADTLHHILARDGNVEGLADSDYYLVGEHLNEAISHSWQRMLTVWKAFEERRAALGETEAGTAVTRSTLLLPLFSELGYGRLSPDTRGSGVVVLPDGSRKSYPVSHFWCESPIHLVGCNVSLDKRSAGVSGAARQSPHSLVQEFLNRSDAHLWGLVSNGLILRVLRDNANFSRQAYVEFDLQAILTSQSFSEFSLLWLVCHNSRVHTDGLPPEKCWLERWRLASSQAAVVALDSLRASVQQAIARLGQGFMDANPGLRGRLAGGDLPVMDYFRQLLRLVYRFIFLFVLEDRGLLHGPDVPEAARTRYRRYYSLIRLRGLARAMTGSDHGDLWEGVRLVMRALGHDGCPSLGLAPLGSFLWSGKAVPDLDNLSLSNRSLLSAVRALAFTSFDGESRPIDWRLMGFREIGSIYESLLELHPERTATSFTLRSAPGNDRKTSGAYYTPDQLIDALLDSALDPVVKTALRAGNPEAAVLGLKICDPACGSGHFLLAAAGRIARHLASLRSGDAEPSPEAQRHALRDVVARCLYGIDINPMSVELCRMGLWLESHEPGKPLSFLDHHVVCANTLMGTDAAHIRNGIPDGAYDPLTGDDKAAWRRLKKASRDKRSEQGKMIVGAFYKEAMDRLLALIEPPDLDAMPADTLADMERRADAYRQWLASPRWKAKKRLYDLWTAAFVIEPRLPDTRKGETLAFGITWRTIFDDVQGTPPGAELLQAVERAAAENRFFHLELVFPDVAAQGGFDVVVGNPPWENPIVKEQEWLTAHGREDLAALPGKTRKKAIADLEREDPALYARYARDQRFLEAQRKFYKSSGIHPLCGSGSLNLYALFAEWMRAALTRDGRLGCVVPTGIATDEGTSRFFQNLVDTRSLVSVYDFENKGIFPDVHSRFKFCLLTAGSGERAIAEQARYVFFARAADDLHDSGRRFALTREDIALLNPNTRTCPIFRTTKDALLTMAIYRRVPILWQEKMSGAPEVNPWDISFRQGLFNMSSDSPLFRTREQLEAGGWRLTGNVFVRGDAGRDAGRSAPSGAAGTPAARARYLPLYEAKMLHHFSHRWATYEGAKARETAPGELKDAGFSPLPRYWIPQDAVEQRLAAAGWTRPWLLGWRDIARATDERTCIASLLPRVGVGHTYPLLFLPAHWKEACLLLGNLCSFVLDYIVRQKVGGTDITYHYLKQFPVLPPDCRRRETPWQPGMTLADWLRPRVLELCYTAEDMRPFAEDMGCAGDPFPWDEERRAALRAELDAAFFHLYFPMTPEGKWRRCAGEDDSRYAALTEAFPTPRDAVSFVMETFPGVRKNDMKNYGRYRTKEEIIRNYDEMAKKMVK